MQKGKSGNIFIVKERIGVMGTTMEEFSFPALYLIRINSILLSQTSLMAWEINRFLYYYLQFAVPEVLRFGHVDPGHHNIPRFNESWLTELAGKSLVISHPFLLLWSLVEVWVRNQTATNVHC